jgi:Domain of unknown function (DUF2703)
MTRQLAIEFLYLDLETCARCRATDATLLEAIARTRPALEAAGVTASLTRTRVATEASASEPGFVSSPTIRINGTDIGGNLVESACTSDGCSCPSGVNCRDWIYQDGRSTEPPLGLIVEAIVRHAFSLERGAAGAPREARGTLPENTRRYFVGAAGDRASAACCAPDVQATCCEPDQKAACCKGGANVSSCGCRA